MEFAELDGHDAYDLLGVDPDTPRDEVRRAYRALAKSSHPDLFSDPVAKAGAEERIRLLNAAREILVNRRAAYDAFRCAPHDEPAEAEVIDDPWDVAEPGTPGRGPAPGPAPSQAWAQPPPDHRRMPPPPQYGYAPGPPPVRRTGLHSPGPRIVLGCGILFGAIWLISLLASVFSALFS